MEVSLDRRKSLFVNDEEKTTNDILNEKCSMYNISIHPKVRLADVLNINNSGISDELYRYALQSHFDFVVYNHQYRGLFAVEVDEEYHKTDKAQITKDNYKNKICSKLEFPLLRINSNYLKKKYRTFSLLGWIIDYWFLREAFLEAQEYGSIPEDEIFWPDAIMYNGNSIMDFPYDLTYDLKRKVFEKYKNGQLYSFCTDIWIGEDKNGNYKGIGCFRLSESEGIIAESGVKRTSFPIDECDMLQTILIYELLEKVLSGKYEKTDIGVIREKVTSYSNKFKLSMISASQRGSS